MCLGEYDFRSRDKEVAAFASKHGNAITQEIETYLRSRRPPVLIELANDRDTMREYWGVIDRQLVMAAERSGDDVGHLRMLYDTYTRDSSPATDALLAQRGLDGDQIAHFKDLVEHVSAQMRQYRRDNPMVERLLFKWGYIESPQSDALKHEVEAIEWLDLRTGNATTDRSVFETHDRFRQTAGPMFDQLDLPRPWDRP